MVRVIRGAGVGALAVWVCLTMCAGSAYAKSPCKEATATPTKACLKLARKRLQSYETRASGLELMRWICRRAEDEAAAAACVEFGDADRGSNRWGVETSDGVRAFYRGCRLGNDDSCAAYVVARYVKGNGKGRLDEAFWGKRVASDVEPGTYPEELARVKALCDGGSMRGCVAQGAMLWLGATALFDKSTTKSGAAIKVDKVGATVLFEHACQGGSRLGCLEHAHALLDDGVTIPGAVAGARASFDEACKGANKRGCATLAFTLDAKGSKISASKRLALAKTGCDQGHLPDCSEWTALDTAAAPVAPFERLCLSEPDVLPCTVASNAYAEATRGVKKADAKKAITFAKRGCGKHMKLPADMKREEYDVFVTYSCNVATDDALENGTYDEALSYQASACAAGTSFGCVQFNEMEHARFHTQCLLGDDAGSCTSSTSLAVVNLSMVKERLPPDDYTEYRLARPAVLAEAFGVSCTRWKEARGCALKALVEKIPKFERARNECVRAPGSTCDDALRLYDAMWRDAQPHKYGKALVLLTAFEEKDLRALASTRCAAKSGEACGLYAQMLHDGRGGPRDAVRAREVGDTGCTLGSKRACTQARRGLGKRSRRKRSR